MGSQTLSLGAKQIVDSFRELTASDKEVVLAELVASAPGSDRSAHLSNLEPKNDIFANLVKSPIARSAGVAAPVVEPAEKTRHTLFQVAQQMVSSYSFDASTGASKFTIPAGVMDITAMIEVNRYFKHNHNYLKRPAICPLDFDWYLDLPKREAGKAREVTITAVVAATAGNERMSQEQILAGSKLIFPDLRDLALTAALHACVFQGEDLFRGHYVRGSVDQFVLYFDARNGVRVSGYDVGQVIPKESIAASGLHVLS